MMRHLLVALFALVALYAAPPAAHAQAPGYINQYNAVCDPKNPKNCVAPNSSGAMPVTGTISASSSEQSTAAAPTYLEGTPNPLSGDLTGGLRVNCQTGCSGGTFNNNTDAVATSATNGTTAAYLYGFNGASFDRIRSDANKYLNIDIQTITASIVLSASSAVIGHVIADSGSTTVVTGNVTVVQPTGTNLHTVLDSGTTAVTQATAASLNATVVGTGTFATQSTLAAGSAIVGKVGIDQTTPGTTNGVQVNAALPAGTNVIGHVINDASSAVIGHVIADTGSTTAVTGNVTVVQGTGSNLHAQLDAGAAVIGHVIADTGSTTAVTQATAANLNATVVGTGTFAAQVTGTVTANAGTNLNTSLLELDTTGAALNLAQGSTTSGQTGPIVQCAATTAAPSYVTAKTDPLSCNLAGGLRVDGSAVTQPISGTVTTTPPSNASTNVAQFGGTNVSTGTGAGGAGIPRVTVSNDSTVGLVAGSALVGKVGIDQTTPGTTNGVSTVAATSGGTSSFTLTLAASTNATNVKASAGQLYSIDGFNMSSATPVWISLYNNAGTPTCGTSIIQQFMIPGNATGAGFVHDFATPIQFTSGIAICATTGIAGTGNPAATTYVVNINFK